MKLIDFYNKLIAPMSSEFSNSLSLIANSLRYGLRNELEIQNLKIYILINTTTTHYTYCIYHPLTHVFYPVLRVCVRVRAREAMRTQPITTLLIYGVRTRARARGNEIFTWMLSLRSR